MSTKTRLLIARHGNTFGPNDIIRRVGTTDLPLSESGLIQGTLLGDYLKQHQLLPDVIYTSNLKRTMQTASQAQAAMQTQITTQALSIFNEIDYGPDENQPEELVVARLGKDTLQAWESEAIVPPGWNVDPNEIIQNWMHFAEQLVNEQPGKTILVITSNGIARFAPHLTGDFQRFAKNHPIKIATGGLCILEKTGSSSYWECVQWNIRPGK